MPLPPPRQGHRDAAASRGAIRARPRRPGPPGCVGRGVRAAFRGSGRGGEPGSRLPLRAFSGEARGAGLGVCASDWERAGEREEKKESEKREEGGERWKKATQDPPPSPKAGAAPSHLPAAGGLGGAEGRGGAAGTPPSPGSRLRGAKPFGSLPPPPLFFPSPPSSLPPSFLPSPGLSRGGRGAQPAVRLHACRRWAPSCPRPPRPGSLPAAPRAPRPGEAALPAPSDVGTRDPGWISEAS